MFELDLSGAEPKEYMFPEGAKEGEPTATVTIRPFPKSLSTSITRRGENGKIEHVFTGEDDKKVFVYCLVKATGFCDKNGKEIPMTDVNKSNIFDFEYIYNTGLPSFVINKALSMTSAKEEQEKN